MKEFLKFILRRLLSWLWGFGESFVGKWRMVWVLLGDFGLVWGIFCGSSGDEVVVLRKVVKNIFLF